MGQLRSEETNISRSASNSARFSVIGAADEIKEESQIG